jgi:hypothetical protein
MSGSTRLIAALTTIAAVAAQAAFAASVYALVVGRDLSAVFWLVVASLLVKSCFDTLQVEVGA